MLVDVTWNASLSHCVSAKFADCFRNHGIAAGLGSYLPDRTNAPYAFNYNVFWECCFNIIGRSWLLCIRNAAL